MLYDICLKLLHWCADLLKHYLGGTLEPHGTQENLMRNPDVVTEQGRAMGGPDHNATEAAAELLESRLIDAQIWPDPESPTCYLPRNKKLTIITRHVIKKHIRLAAPNNASVSAEDVYNRAVDLFTILAYIKRAHEICDFLDEGVSDLDLPFKCDPNNGGVLKRKNGTDIQVTQHWAKPKRLEFGQKQWCVLVPIFSGQEHHVLHRSTVLPFLHEKLVNEGAYSQVYGAEICEGHYNYSFASEASSRLTVAIKKLRGHIRGDFEKERRILNSIKAKEHGHLAELLFTYEYQTYEEKEIYNLVFLRADGNLREYWGKNPSPPFDREAVLWSLRQMRGITDALQTIHTFIVDKPHTMREERQMLGGPAVISLVPGEERFGRHGDLKPENILFFKSLNGEVCCKITDFGLGRFHGHDTRTKDAPYTIYSSPTYEPPECHLGMSVSRRYDVWSLACLFLEWLSWMLKGSQAIEDFSGRRLEQSYITNGNNLQDDYFWSLQFNNTVRRAIVRQGVRDWVSNLREDPKCSPLIKDLLKLIMDKLLRIRPEHRCEMAELKHQLDQLLAKAERDVNYAIRAVPN